jgi:hypothetical protein
MRTLNDSVKNVEDVNLASDRSIESLKADLAEVFERAESTMKSQELIGEGLLVASVIGNLIRC